jgi:hypothetical protein
MFLGLKMATKFRLPFSFCLGIATRVFVMMVVNLSLFYVGLMRFPPSYSEIPLLLIILLTGVFNVIEGTISIVGGYLIYVTIKRRSPSLMKKNFDSGV